MLAPYALLPLLAASLGWHRSRRNPPRWPLLSLPLAAHR
jgi:hypothetical protein